MKADAASLIADAHQGIVQALLLSGCGIVLSALLLLGLVRVNHTDDGTAVLTARSGWIHISWSPFAPPRHDVRIGYYK